MIPEEERAVICDLGTGYMKMGFGNDTFPSRTFASIVGRPMLRAEEIIDDVALKPIMIGDEVTKYRSILQLSYPTEEGIVRKWDDMELLLDYSFKSIKCDNMSGRSLMMTEAVGNPTINRVKMAQLLFEKFHVGRLQLGLQALMALFAEARTTAMLIDSGDGVTHCIPVFDNHILNHQICRLNIAGRHITHRLVKLMHMQGYAFNSTADFQLVRDLKEKYCFVSGDIQVDQKLAQETVHHLKKHTLPDGSEIRIGRERFLAPEILFNPSVDGLEYPGCAEMVFKSINDSDVSLRKEFYASMLISGGTTMFPGFPTRLRNEVEALYRQRILKNSSARGVPIQVIDSPARKYNVFIGAAFIAQKAIKIADSWITKAQYDEHGDRIMEKFNYGMK